MNILFLTSQSPFDELTGPIAAGAEIAMRRIAEKLAARGHNVHYVSLTNDPDRQIVQLNDVTVHLLPRRRVKKNRASWLSKFILRPLYKWAARSQSSYRRALQYSLRRFVVRMEHYSWGFKNYLHEVATRHNIDVIHCFSSLPDSLAAAIISEELHIPIVIRMGGRYWYLKYRHFEKESKRQKYLDQVRLVFDEADCLAFNSAVLREHTTELFDQLGVRAPANQPIIDIGVELPKEGGSTFEPVNGHQIEGRFVASCIGKFKPDSKRQDLLIEAVKQIGDEVPLTLFFAGGGPNQEQLEQVARTEHVADRLVFLGDIPHASVFKLIEQSDVVIHPTEFEGSSKAIAETMLCGKPVIASAIPAIEEHIRDGENGLLAENAAESFADRIRYLYRHDDERKRLGRNALQYAQQHFDPDQNILEYEKLFRSVIEGTYRRPKRDKFTLPRIVETLDLAIRRSPRHTTAGSVTPTHWRNVERQGLGRRRVAGGKLAYFWTETNSSYWDEHWQNHLTEKRYRHAEKGELGDREPLLKRHLPKHGRIIEAGCGPGHLVLALRVLGYDCEGVDYAEETVNKVRAARPDIPMSVGDVKNLDVPDGHYAGYISLGVVEHDQQGPEQFFEEAHRVLADDGVAIISVPHYHLLRRIKARMGFFLKSAKGMRFYQYAYGQRAMSGLLRGAGFDVVAEYHTNPVKGLSDELPLLKDILAYASYGPALKRWIQGSDRLTWLFGHNIMFVCKKSLSASS